MNKNLDFEAAVRVHDEAATILGLCISEINKFPIDFYRDTLVHAGGIRGILEKDNLQKEYPALAEAWANRDLCNRLGDRVQMLREQGIGVLALGSSRYPELLFQIPDPPPVVYYRGTILDGGFPASSIAVVGSRSADPEACEIAERLSFDLCRGGVCVVSGLAFGIDAAAHQGALRAGRYNCPTVAVLGHGFDYLYPAGHRDLAEQIVDAGGLLITQFKPEEKPFPQHFLKRNFVIAGLSQAVLVVQAAKRSGALVTVRAALEQGREVLVVPGSINHPRYEGSNLLIRNGATLVSKAEDIFEAVPAIVRQQELVNERPDEEAKAMSALAAEIVAYLKRSNCISCGDIAQQVKRTSIEIETELLQLEVDGIIERLPGGLVILANS